MTVSLPVGFRRTPDHMQEAPTPKAGCEAPKPPPPKAVEVLAGLPNGEPAEAPKPPDAGCCPNPAAAGCWPVPPFTPAC